MSLEIWPKLPPGQLKAVLDLTQARELDWQLQELDGTLADLKQSLQDCYNLLNPGGRGNTLVVSTPRNEIVKGHVTRNGTQIVKGTMQLRLRTLPPQTITIDTTNPITIAPLETLQTLLTRSIDLLTLTLSFSYPRQDVPEQHGKRESLHSFHGDRPGFIAAQLRVLSQALSDASALLRGPPLSMSDPAWTNCSAALSHFSPPLPPSISFHIGLQDSQLVLWLRALEPVGVPVNFGMKFALALGTARRLDHDEADKVFNYCCENGMATGLHPLPPGSVATEGNRDSENSGVPLEGPAKVHVREKVRIESADPSLLSLSAKLSALSHSLLLARTNLAAVMGDVLETEI